MSLFDAVVTTQPRPLPVFLLVDVSGSMGTNSKIDVANQSVREMINTLANLDDTVGEIQISVITFGGDSARVHTALAPVTSVDWIDMEAKGRTPLGSALSLAAKQIEDEAIVPKRSYMPHLVVISDGIPTDEWREGLARLRAGKRSSRAIQLAIAIQSEQGDETYEVLREIVVEPERIFAAADAAQIAEALRWVSLAVSRSATIGARDIASEPASKPDLESL